MSDDIKAVCERMTRLIEEFAENSDAVDELLARDNAEDLLVALALAEGLIQGLLTLEPKADAHIRTSEGELKEILQEFEDSEEEDDE